MIISWELIQSSIALLFIAYRDSAIAVMFKILRAIDYTLVSIGAHQTPTVQFVLSEDGNASAAKLNVG